MKVSILISIIFIYSKLFVKTKEKPAEKSDYFYERNECEIYVFLIHYYWMNNQRSQTAWDEILSCITQAPHSMQLWRSMIAQEHKLNTILQLYPYVCVQKTYKGVR
jgi:hypothetical protein